MQAKSTQSHMADYGRTYRQHLIQSTVDLCTTRPDLSVGEAKHDLDAAGMRLRGDGYGNFTLELKRQRALHFLNTLPERDYVPEVPTVLVGGGK